MLSLSHGSVLGFDFLGLRGAVVFKSSEQAVLNRLRCFSATKSGKKKLQGQRQAHLVKGVCEVIIKVGRKVTSQLYSRSNA